MVDELLDDLDRHHGPDVRPDVSGDLDLLAGVGRLPELDLAGASEPSSSRRV